MISFKHIQLGGTGADEDGRYILGDDALGCLKDLKKWLKLHDEKANRLDVARCLAEANLLSGDLLPILAAWSEEEGRVVLGVDDNRRMRGKVALACCTYIFSSPFLGKKVCRSRRSHMAGILY